MKAALALAFSLSLLFASSYAHGTEANLKNEIEAVKLVKLRAGDRGIADSFFDHFTFTSSTSSKLRDIEQEIIETIDLNGSGTIEGLAEYEGFREIYRDELAIADIDQDGVISEDELMQLTALDEPSEDLWCKSFIKLQSIVGGAGLLDRLVDHCNGEGQ